MTLTTVIAAILALSLAGWLLRLTVSLLALLVRFVLKGLLFLVVFVILLMTISCII